MTNEEIIRILIEFFDEGFREDPAGVGDWFADGGNDIDEFVNALADFRRKRLQAEGWAKSEVQWAKDFREGKTERD